MNIKQWVIYLKNKEYFKCIILQRGKNNIKKYYFEKTKDMRNVEKQVLKNQKVLPQLH